MIKEYVQYWDKNKNLLDGYFKTHDQRDYSDYLDLVKLLFEIVINPDIPTRAFDLSKITVIDDGDYQGTQIFIIPADTYQPNVSEYVYTNTYYGSCSGCDTLQGIQSYGLPDENQIKDYMILCLQLLQSCAYMIDGEEEIKEMEIYLGGKNNG